MDSFDRKNARYATMLLSPVCRPFPNRSESLPPIRRRTSFESCRQYSASSMLNISRPKDALLSLFPPQAPPSRFLPTPSPEERSKVNCLNSGHVPICRLIDIADPLQVLALDQTLNLLLQQIDVGREASGELLDDLGDELLVLEFFALPVCFPQTISKTLTREKRKCFM